MRDVRAARSTVDSQTARQTNAQREEFRQLDAHMSNVHPKRQAQFESRPHRLRLARLSQHVLVHGGAPRAQKDQLHSKSDRSVFLVDHFSSRTFDFLIEILI